MMKRVDKQLSEVNAHYSADNIAKRDSWMKWVNDRSAVYDESIVAINKSLVSFLFMLKKNFKTRYPLSVSCRSNRFTLSTRWA